MVETVVSIFRECHISFLRAKIVSSEHVPLKMYVLFLGEVKHLDPAFIPQHILKGGVECCIPTMILLSFFTLFLGYIVDVSLYYRFVPCLIIIALCSPLCNGTGVSSSYGGLLSLGFFCCIISSASMYEAVMLLMSAIVTTLFLINDLLK